MRNLDVERSPIQLRPFFARQIGMAADKGGSRPGHRYPALAAFLAFRGIGGFGWGMFCGGFLSAEDRRHLIALARDGSAAARLTRRANALALLDDGWSCHAADLNSSAAASGAPILAFDGKALKGSFDAFNDAKARQILSAFAVDTAFVLAQINKTSNSTLTSAIPDRVLHHAETVITANATFHQRSKRGSK